MIDKYFEATHLTQKNGPQARHEKSSNEELSLPDLLALLSDETSIPDEVLSTVKIDLPDFETAIKIVQPSSMREGFATVPNVTWWAQKEYFSLLINQSGGPELFRDDVGALEEIRSELETSILAPVKHPGLKS